MVAFHWSELDGTNKEVLGELMRNLEWLESSTDLEGSAIVSKTGLRVASSETADVVADIYSASPATLISLGEKISSGLEQGELKEIVIRGTNGYTIIVVGSKDNNFMLFTNCKKGYKLGYYFHKIRKAFRIMEPLLKQIEKQGTPQY
ncbi:MAG: roadblock/LC7 domain-containing protein [Candidatus Lokiarchaeota archaeon]|nr:roadblock/LC7 domain-containing protein [Candidatus Lokiarchaeota archaeon]